MEVNYNKTETSIWVHGTVTQVSVETETFDVTYDDGYVDMSVQAQYMRLETEAPPIVWSETDAASSLTAAAAAGNASLAPPCSKCAQLLQTIEELQASTVSTTSAAASTGKATARTSSATDQELLDLELEDLEKERLLDACLQFKYLFIEADESSRQSASDLTLLMSRKEVRN